MGQRKRIDELIEKRREEDEETQGKMGDESEREQERGEGRRKRGMEIEKERESREGG